MHRISTTDTGMSKLDDEERRRRAFRFQEWRIVAGYRTATLFSTFVIILSCVICAAILHGENNPIIFLNQCASILLAGILSMLMIELKGGFRNLIRVDIFMMIVLYVLTFLEFLFIDKFKFGTVHQDHVRYAAYMIILSFCGLAIGRHSFPRISSGSKNRSIATWDLPPSKMILILFTCFSIGFLHIFIAVDFNIFNALDQMTQPRFDRAWSRGKFGTLSTLLNELGLAVYLIPPITGAVFARRNRYTFLQQLIVMMIIMFTLFYGFTLGTRNVFLTYLVTFIVSFLIFTPRITFLLMATLSVFLAPVIFGAIYYLPEIRTVGFNKFSLSESHTENLFVDMNILTISRIVELFPSNRDYLGFEIPYVAVIRPIPRALWASKPEGLSVSIEEAVGVTNMTVSATYVGEFYMAGGAVAVFLASLTFGACAAAWNRVGARARSSGQLILFASGFFAAGLCMRSFLSMVPAIIPVVLFFLLYRTQRRLVNNTG